MSFRDFCLIKSLPAYGMNKDIAADGNIIYSEFPEYNAIVRAETAQIIKADIKLRTYPFCIPSVFSHFREAYKKYK